MRNSKTLELFESFKNESEKLDEKINKDNIEINRAIANPNLGANQDKITKAGYEVDYDGQYIKNPKNGKGVWVRDFDREKRKKVDFKGMLDKEGNGVSKTTRYDSDVKDNRLPKSAKVGKNSGYGTYNRDEVEYYSPTYRDGDKKSISSNVNYYKKAVRDRDEESKRAESIKKSDIPYYEKKAKEANDQVERYKKYASDAQSKADSAEAKRKALIDNIRAKRKTESEEPLKEENSNFKVFINTPFGQIDLDIAANSKEEACKLAEDKVKEAFTNDYKEQVKAVNALALNESEKPLKESYDMYNVIEDSTIEIRNLKEKIDNGEVKDLAEVSRLLDMILKNIDENISEAW